MEENDMQIYSTMLPITERLTTKKFIELVIAWNQGSPYNKIQNLNWDGENHNIKFEDGNISLAIEELRAHNITAIRFFQIDNNNVIWTTDFVAAFNDRALSIKIDRETTEQTLGYLPEVKPPVIINKLLEGGYIGTDRDLEINDKLIPIDMTNYTLIEKAICRECDYKLPIIYVTKSWGQYPCNVSDLAYRLRGSAHVFAEEDDQVCKMLRETCNGENAHHGSIGIYYPNSAVRSKIIKTYMYEGRSEELIDKVVRTVLRYMNLQARTELQTWEGIQNELLRLKYEKAEEKKREAEDEVSEVYNNFDQELDKQGKTIEELNNRIIALTNENKGLRARLENSEELPLLLYGTEEEDFFEGEILDFVIEALQKECNSAIEGSRRQHVLQDVIKNNQSEGRLADNKETIKRLLKGCKKVDDSLKRKLSDMGFSISKEGRHYKLTYYGDPRYLFIMPVTGSDGQHGGKNLASEIGKKVW